MNSVQVMQYPLEDNGGACASWGPYPYPELLSWDVHQAFQIKVVLSGQVEKHFEGLVRTLGPGDVCLIPSWEPHGHRTAASGTAVWGTLFLPEFLGDEMLGGLSWLSFFMAAPRERPWVDAEDTRRQVLGIAEELKPEIDQQGRGWLTSLRLGLLRLLWVTGRNWEPSAAGNGRHSARLSSLARIAPALDLVHARAGRPVSLAEAAAACVVSVPAGSPLSSATLWARASVSSCSVNVGRGPPNCCSAAMSQSKRSRMNSASWMPAICTECLRGAMATRRRATARWHAAFTSPKVPQIRQGNLLGVPSRAVCCDEGPERFGDEATAGGGPPTARHQQIVQEAERFLQ